VTAPTFWDWALEAYGREGVAEACLDLQDRHGQCVPLLLWAAWLSAREEAASDDTLEAACDIARAWDNTTLEPLRALRRKLKSPHPDIEAGARLDMRQKTIELERRAEHHLMQALEHLPREAAQGAETLKALVSVTRVWSPVTPRKELQTLTACLSA
jgi:uncharacterized protein (TIGR02444 family)